MELAGGPWWGAQRVTVWARGHLHGRPSVDEPGAPGVVKKAASASEWAGGRQLAWEGGVGEGDSHRCSLRCGVGYIWGRAMLSNICGTVE